MITKNSTRLDKEDAAVLFLAMCKFGEENNEGGLQLDRSLVSVGFAEMMQRAELAARVVAQQHTEEGDDWDGVVWFELLERTDVESLAAKLFQHDGEAKKSQGVIIDIALDWLARIEA